MTTDLAEKLTPSKGPNEANNTERLKILEAIGKICTHQGEYHMATKKFTQSGNRVKVREATRMHFG